MYLYPQQQDIAILHAHGAAQFSSIQGDILFIAPGYTTYNKIINWAENARHNANWKTGPVIDYFLKTHGLARYGFKGVGAIISVGDTLRMKGYDRSQAFEVLALADNATHGMSLKDTKLVERFAETFDRCANISAMKELNAHQKNELVLIDMPVDQIRELLATGTPVSYILQLHPQAQSDTWD